MAILGSNVLTLTEWATRVNPDGSTPVMAELLTQANEILGDIVWKESNLPTQHIITQRLSLPTPSFRAYNEGSRVTHSTVGQITESIGMLEDWSEADVDLAMLNGDVSTYRAREANAHFQGMSQAMAENFLYGNIDSNPAAFTGFSNRYNTVASSSRISENVIDGGGTGADNTSIWLVGWGDVAICGIFPKGTKAGLIHDDMGKDVIATDTNGVGTNRLAVYQDRWQWKAGLSVENWRYAVRICNIDTSNLVSGTGAANLIENMSNALHIPTSLSAAKFSFYMNRTVFAALDRQRYSNLMSGGGVTYHNIDGRAIPHFREIPIKICDRLVNTESRVV